MSYSADRDQSSSAPYSFTAPPYLDTQPTQRVADVLLEILVQSGVEVVFGLPGGPIGPIYDAFLDHPELRVIAARHENSAMFAAAGYARATGKLGVVVVTSGPGIFNAMNGLASAYCEGVPLLVIVGEVSRANTGRRALQEGTQHFLDVLGATRGLTKLATTVSEPNALPAALRRTMATAMSGVPGPVLMTIPVDVLRAHIRVPRIASEVRLSCTVDRFLTNNVALALRASKRPVILAGSGCRAGNGPALLRQLAETLQIPVITTPKAKGVFPEGHPLALGIFGVGGHPSSRQYLQAGIDTMLAAGTSLGELATEAWSKLLIPSEHFIQIDADAMQIGRNYPVTLGIAASCELVFEQLLEQLGEQSRPSMSFGVEYERKLDEIPDLGNGIAAPLMLSQLQQAFPPDTIYTCDIGEHLLFALHYLKIDRPDSFVVMSGLGSMGSGIGASLGVQLAHPGRRVVSICGDGGFLMNLHDVATAVSENLPITFVVLNDRRYGMVELGQKSIFGRTMDLPTESQDISLLAQALGAGSEMVRSVTDIKRACARAALMRAPAVIDVWLDRSVAMQKNERFETLSEVARLA